MNDLPESELVRIARAMRSVAVVGIKDADAPDAPAYDVPLVLAESGVRVIGVNPRVPRALGQPTLARVGDLETAPDVVNVFRRSSAIPELADELLALPAALRAPVVWLQTGIRHDGAAARLAAGGYQVVQDRGIRCIHNPDAGNETRFTIRTMPQADRPKKVVVVGSASVTLSAGHSTTLHVVLNGAGKTLLAKRHVLPAKLAAIQAGQTRATARLVFKAKRKH